MLKKIKKKSNFFLLFIVALAIAFIVITQNKLIENYHIANSKINHKNLKSLIEKLEDRIDFIHKLSLEYSSLDETYEFINDQNPDYIYSNFRKDSYTLEDIDLSYFILTNKSNKLLFSKKTRHITNAKDHDFEEYLIKKLKKIKKTNGIIRYKNNSYFISKAPVYQTDYSENSNGFLILGKKIDNLYLKNINSNFLEVRFSNKPNEISNYELVSKTFPKIIVNSHQEIDFFTNNIYFYNEKNELLLSIQTENNVEISDDIFMTTCILSTFLLLIILILILTLNSYKKLFSHNQKNIENQIDIKTKQIKNAMEELEKVNLQLYDIAHTDHLTKTMNRRNFFIHAHNIFSVSKKENIEFTTVMIDIDNFKTYNDKYGHDVGDRVLIEFTKTIKDKLESNDIFGRLGGEEFALVFPKTNLKNAIKKVEEIKEEIEQIDIFVYEDVINITASFGISDNYGSNNIDEMLQKSDKLLYNAKKDGKNLVRSRLNLS